MQGFLAEALPALVATANDRGAPEMTPIWYEYADGQIRFNGDRSRIWLARMEQTGRATFMVVDPTNMWRWAQVYGNVVDAREDPGGEHINRLSHRYRGARITAANATPVASWRWRSPRSRVLMAHPARSGTSAANVTPGRR